MSKPLIQRKGLLFLLFLTSSTVLYVGGALALGKAGRLGEWVERKKVHFFISRELEAVRELKANSDKALAISSFVYRNTSVGQNGNLAPITTNNLRSALTAQVPVLCNGIATVYQAILSSFSIQNRRVNFATDAAVSNRAMDDTHTAVEVLWDDGSWVLVDPTFNVIFVRNGLPLGALALHELRKQFHEIEIVPIEPEIQDDIRDIGKYYLPYEKLLENVSIVDFDPFSAKEDLVVSEPIKSGWRYLAMASGQGAPTSYSENLELVWQASSPIGSNLKVKGKLTGRADGQIEYVSTLSNSNYEIESPPIQVEAGRYVASVAIEIRRGGAELGVLDQKTRSWIASSKVSSLSGDGIQTLFAEFEVADDVPIRLILSNWSLSHKEPSVWAIHEIKLLGPDRSQLSYFIQ